MKLWIIIAIVVAYPNIGWSLWWAVSNPEKTGVFKTFLTGPKWKFFEKEKSEKDSEEDHEDTYYYKVSSIFWPLLIACLIIVWLIELIFGGIAKRIIGDK